VPFINTSTATSTHKDQLSTMETTPEEKKVVNETSATKASAQQAKCPTASRTNVMISGKSSRAHHDHQHPNHKPAEEKKLAVSAPPGPPNHDRHYHSQKPKEEEVDPERPYHLLGGMHHRRHRSPPVSPEINRRHHSPLNNSHMERAAVLEKELHDKKLLVFDIVQPQSSNSGSPLTTTKQTGLSDAVAEQPAMSMSMSSSPYKIPSKRTLKQEMRAREVWRQFDILAATSPLEEEEEATEKAPELEQDGLSDAVAEPPAKSTSSSSPHKIPAKRTVKQEMRARELRQYDILAATSPLEEEATEKAPDLEQRGRVRYGQHHPKEKGGPKPTRPVAHWRLRSAARHDRHYVI
jgi:hypothetical protein